MERIFSRIKVLSTHLNWERQLLETNSAQKWASSTEISTAELLRKHPPTSYTRHTTSYFTCNTGSDEYLFVVIVGKFKTGCL